MEIRTKVSRGLRAARRSFLVALALLVLASAALPTSASSAGVPSVHASRPSDGYGDNPTMP